MPVTLNTLEVAQALGITAQSVIALAQSGKLRGSFFLRQWKFTPEAINDFLNATKRSR